MSARTIKDVTKALQPHFSNPKATFPLPPEIRRLLQNYVHARDEQNSEEESSNINAELKRFWERYGEQNPQKLGSFIGVLRELRTATQRPSAVLEWWQLVVRPIVGGTGYTKPVLEDARAYILGAMAIDPDDLEAYGIAMTSTRICNDLVQTHLTLSQPPSEGDEIPAPENRQVAQQVEDVLLAFGRQKPKELIQALDSLIVDAKSRLRALSLLNSFLRQEIPHIYLVTETALVDTLTRCLLNDSSNTSLSMALTSLTMLLPNVPGALPTCLPRLFLIYSRLLCWERHSDTEAERSLVTDDRVANQVDEDGRDAGLLGFDPAWSKLRPDTEVVENSKPELMTYFTYLYGMFPLNLMSYIRKPRRFLMDSDFPSADAFDIDSEVIRRRSEQFRQQHTLHPNFCNLTIEDELNDPKWTKMDVADIVGSCHSLCINKNARLLSPGPPPRGKLPDLPPVPLSAVSKRSSGVDSPVAGSIRSFGPGGEGLASPIPRSNGGPLLDDDPRRPRSKASGTTLRTTPSMDDFASAVEAASDRSGKPHGSGGDIAWLHREIQLLRNDLNFERWHKAQYSQHIGNITRKNVRDATIEAETLNLINANKALKRQLEQVQKAREATIKDSTLTRKQANSLESDMAERFSKLKTEQEKWRVDAEELQRLRSEAPQYRELLVASEARELSKSHELQLATRDLEKLRETQTQLQDSRRRLREYEYREFEFSHTTREREILENEKELLQMKVQRYADERERMRHHFSERIAELEARLADADMSGRASTQPSVDSRALADTQSKLLQLRKAHSRLLEKHTDLELDYQAVKSQQLSDLRTHGSSAHSFQSKSGDGDTLQFSRLGQLMEPPALDFDFVGDYDPSEAGYGVPSSSEPTNRRYHPNFVLPVSPPKSEITMHNSAGLTWRPETSRAGRVTSKNSGAGVPPSFNPSAPLGSDDANSVLTKSTSQSVTGKKPKITPDSQARVYGRGGAQNIKLKPKDSTKDKGEGNGKKSALRSLRGLV